MDPYRLPRHVVPTRYEIRLEPDLVTASFTGAETIAVTVTEPTTEIVLNAAELSVTDAALENERGERRRATVALEESLERCRLTFPASIAPGHWRLHLVFSGILNDKLRGFYRSTYKDAAGLSRTLAATQF